jgi:hypothetical protein
MFEALKGAIGSPGEGFERVRQPPQALMVVGVHLLVAGEAGRYASRVHDLDAVLGELARPSPVAIDPEDVGEVLHKIAAERDIDELTAAANTEHREIAMYRAIQ